MSASKLLLCLSVLLFALGVVLVDGATAYAQLGTVTKTDNESGSVQPGDHITYTVTIPNTGTKQAKNVVFSDFPDPFTTLVVGSVTTTHGTVTMGNGSGDSHIVVEVGTLDPGQTAVINFQVIVLGDVLQTPCGCTIEVHNQGFVNSDLGSTPTCDDEPDEDCDTDTPVEPTPPELEAAKSCALQGDADGSGQLSQGDTMRYVITIPNTGPVPTDAVFSDNLDPNTKLVIGSVTASRGTVLAGNGSGDGQVLVNLGTLNPGQSATIAFNVIINADVTQVTNQGFVDFSGTTIPTDDVSTGAPQDSTVCQVFPRAVPAVDSFKSVSVLNDLDGNNAASPGDVLQYTIRVLSTGTAPASDIVFSDTPDAQTRLIAGSVTTTQGIVTLGNLPGHTTVSVNVGKLAPGQTATIRFNVTINADASGIVANQGIVRTPGGDTPTDNPDTPPPDDTTDIPVTPKGVPDLDTPTKRVDLAADADGNGAVSAGDTLRYTIRIPNNGSGAAQNVTFNDTLDPNTALVAGSVTTSHGSVVLGNGIGDAGVSVNVGTLGPGQTAVITFEALIQPGTRATLISNQGTVTPGPTPTDNPDTPRPGDSTDIPVTPQGPPILPTKDVDLQYDQDGNGKASAQDTLRYTIAVPNKTNRPIAGVVFTDFLDPNTILVAGSVVASKGSVLVGNGARDEQVRVQIGTLGAGETVAIHFDAVIKLGATRILNQGFIDAPDIGRTPTDFPKTPEPDDATPTDVTPTPLAVCEIGMIWKLSSTALIVELSDHSKGQGNDIVDWAWDFGDGKTCSTSNPAGCSAVFGNEKIEGTLQRPIHIFNGMGRFVIKLTVTDRQGIIDTSSCAFSFGDPPVIAVLDADADQLLDDDEIRTAIDYWVTGRPVPNTGGKLIDDKLIKVLINLWIKGEPISQAIE